jgi:hypothetical protein
MGRGRAAGEEGGGRQARKVEGGRGEEGARKLLRGSAQLGSSEEGGQSALHRARVPLAGGGPGPLAARGSSDTASWPAPAISTLPPLALGGMGGDALSNSKSWENFEPIKTCLDNMQWHQNHKQPMHESVRLLGIDAL